MKNPKSLKDASELFCPNEDCPARGKSEAGNIVSHGKQRERYKCKICKRTFSAHEGTMFEGLRKPEAIIIMVVTLLSYGCPPQAIVHAFGLDERTVARWQERAGQHCRKVHEEQVLQGKLDLQHVQADEVRVKASQKIPWMAFAIMVSTRLWLGGVVSVSRDRKLADRLWQMVKACCQPLRPLLALTDGWSAYPGSIRRAFREPVKIGKGQGRSRLIAWPHVLIGTVIKRTQKKQVVEVVRRMTQGAHQAALLLLHVSGGGKDLNTAFIERLNATFRQRLACLTRRCRHVARRVDRLEAGMWLVGGTYNFCWPHHELSRRKATETWRKGEVLTTPAMAAGLTDHVWSVRELLAHRIAPPAWVAPKRRGRPPKVVASAPAPSDGRPRSGLHPRKGASCASTT